MKMMKLALLGGAALAVTAVAAQADDLAALKAEIESLNARVAQLEATPSVPAGYQLVTIAEGEATSIPGVTDLRKDQIAYGNKATVISVLPTADVPASTVIEWSGFARAAIRYTNYGDQTVKSRDFVVTEDGDRVNGDFEVNPDLSSDDSQNWDIPSRGQLRVTGKTDTAVGEVGARIQFRANFKNLDTNPTAVFNEYWGWWAMTPEITLGGGYTGSLGNVGYGYDGACNCYYTDNADVGFNPGDTSQIRLSWASGPFSMGIAIEDNSATLFTTSDSSGAPQGYTKFGGVGDAQIGVAGEIKYSGDSFNGEISAVWHNTDDASLGSYNIELSDSWQIGAGAGFALGDIASISLGAATGTIVNGQDFWGVSGLVSFNLSDAVHAEVAAGYKDYSDSGNSATLSHASGAAFDVFTPLGVRPDVTAVLAGIYYDPVPQLTIGLEGEWFQNDSTSSAHNFYNSAGDLVAGTDFEKSSQDNYNVDLVTIFRF